MRALARHTKSDFNLKSSFIDLGKYSDLHLIDFAFPLLLR